MDKVSISAGKIVTGSAGISIGVRETPVHISLDGYVAKLQWMKKQHFIFWDTDFHRGWLANGSRALLHLLRAMIQHTRLDLQLDGNPDMEKLPDLDNRSQASSAIKFLLNKANREIKLYVNRTEICDEYINDNSTPQIKYHYHLLEHEVEHIYSVLEKLLAHQIIAEEGQDGINVNLVFQQHLVGWDFDDLITKESPLRRRVADLQTVRSGWLDFTRKIHAVTLFGRGFGELIRPIRTTSPQSCEKWSYLPGGMDYLAACMADLQTIMDKQGDPTASPKRLCEDVTWRINYEAFEPCPCVQDGTNKHYQPLQDINSSSNFKTYPGNCCPTPPEIENGAVIFRLPWHWGKHESVGDKTVVSIQPQQNFLEASESSETDSSLQRLPASSEVMTGSSSALTTPSEAALSKGNRSMPSSPETNPEGSTSNSRLQGKKRITSSLPLLTRQWSHRVRSRKSGLISKRGKGSIFQKGGSKGRQQGKED